MTDKELGGSLIDRLILEDEENEIDNSSKVLTTIDNPFNPKTEYYKWKRFDTDNHYNTEEYIARLMLMDGPIKIEDEFELIMRTTKAVEDILANDDQDLYILV